MKILFAEDDLTTRMMLQSVLSKWGYEVVTAADGNEAWDAMQQEDEPKLLILDWMMPGMDGPELCRRLRSQERLEALYIIFLTSKSDRRDIVQGLEAGADDFISKPFDNDVLRARIEVGKRILSLQARLREKEKLQGALEMAGTVCHELNQPLQAMNSNCELLMMKLAENEPANRMLKNIQVCVLRIGELTRRIMNISKYKNKSYISDKRKIVDIGSGSME